MVSEYERETILLNKKIKNKCLITAKKPTI